MTNVVALIAVLAAATLMVGSCSWAAVESQRTQTEAKFSCFDADGNWDFWTQSCQRKSP